MEIYHRRMKMKYWSLFLVLLLCAFHLAGVEKILEVKGPLALTGTGKEIPCDPKFNFSPEQSFTVELEYCQDAPNPAASHSSSLVRQGLWRINAANHSGTPVFIAAGRENGQWKIRVMNPK